jgi:cytochrome c peroxidase
MATPPSTWSGFAVALLGAALVACGGGGAVGTAGSNDPGGAVPPPAVLQPAINMAAPDNYVAPVLPAHYDADVAALDNTPPADLPSDRIATLGRVLFYDRALSTNGFVSCATCHQQSNGFSDSARFSSGVGPTPTAAHAMRLVNLRYFRLGSAFWDRRAATIEIQAGQPIQDPNEMGFDAAHGGLAALEAKLQALPYYPPLFQAAFGDSTVSEERVRRALAQFQRAMVSTQSRWDSAYALVYNPALADKGLNTPLPGFSAEEDRGRALFMQGPQQGGAGCASCHQPPGFALAPGTRSNGLDAGETKIFKSPSLKSVGRSSAFMHDGRLGTLAQVVAHYNSGVQAGPALDNRLRTPDGQPLRLNLSAADQAALVAFMLTLDDLALAADTRFADPFVR